ncbi:MAG: hypothetical protein M3O28_07855 [Actinomycetota bacterium]|nr:hypothetical protein [Actinomycetota bacterium]
MPAGLPPLGLQAEVVYPDGSTTRWDSQSQAKDIPTGISFRTKRFDGFGDGSMTLHRRIDIDYPDLRLLGGLNLIGADGSIAYEGRIATAPKSVTAGQGHQVTVQTQGWMSSARDQPLVEVYVDRDLSKWGPMSRQRRIDTAAVNYTKQNAASVLADSSGTPVVETAFADSWVSPQLASSEAWWAPTAGVPIGKLYYNFVAYAAAGMNPADPKWSVAAILTADDRNAATIASASLWPTPASGYLAGGASTTAAMLQLRYDATPFGTQGQGYYAHWKDTAVYGNHGLPLHGTDPQGVYASDVIKDICSRFCPNINATAITPTTFVIPHLSFLTDTDPYDAFLEVNKYHRFGLEVYEKRSLRFSPLDFTDWDWEVRASDLGTSFQLQGDDVQHLVNGVVVHYRDLLTGRDTRLHPATYTALKDPNPNNPATVAGVNRYTSLTLSAPTTQAGALQIGAAFLAEFVQVMAPGTITVTGHIRDRAGHFQQVWKVRAGDRVAITDSPNDRPRLIVETDYSHDAKTLNMSVDASFKKLDAVLDRINVALQASNVQSP